MAIKWRSVIRWLSLIGCLVAGLLYLYGATFSLWVTGGPPNDFKESWEQRGLWQLCLAFAFLFIGVSFFLAVPKFPRLSKLAVLFFGFSVGLLVIPAAREFLLTDACLDSGGSWNKAKFRCKK